MEKKDFFLIISVICALVIAIALGFLHFTCNVGLGIAQ